jgi:hypothetical protein
MIPLALMWIWEWAPAWPWMQKPGSDIAKRGRTTRELCMPFEDVKRRCFGLAFLERRALGAVVEMTSWISWCKATLERAESREKAAEVEELRAEV